MGATAIRRAILACSVTMLLGLSMISVAAAGETPTPGAPTAGSSTFSGKVSKTGSTINVNSNGQNRAVNPAPNTTVIRDGKAASINDLKDGDQVNVTTNPDGTAARIETTSAAKSGNGFLKWLIPLLILLALIGLIAYLMSRRKKDNFVLERDRAGNAGDRTDTPRA